MRPPQNGRHFADDIFKCIFLNDSAWILINISSKSVPRGPINNIQALVQIMVWRRPGDKPLSGPMMVRLRTHICVSRPCWVQYPLDSNWSCLHYKFAISIVQPSKNVIVWFEIRIWTNNGHPKLHMVYIGDHWSYHTGVSLFSKSFSWHEEPNGLWENNTFYSKPKSV